MLFILIMMIIVAVVGCILVLDISKLEDSWEYRSPYTYYTKSFTGKSELEKIRKKLNKRNSKF